ncbi:hypothetical protein BC628DRAFT_523338 [Trametes gibbosa]|nr:hypothetical protein BC628DRAFT_523338 [Trametes gibbosa]
MSQDRRAQSTHARALVPGPSMGSRRGPPWGAVGLSLVGSKFARRRPLPHRAVSSFGAHGPRPTCPAGLVHPHPHAQVRTLGAPPTASNAHTVSCIAPTPPDTSSHSSRIHVIWPLPRDDCAPPLPPQYPGQLAHIAPGHSTAPTPHRRPANVHPELGRGRLPRRMLGACLGVGQACVHLYGIVVTRSRTRGAHPQASGLELGNAPVGRVSGEQERGPAPSGGMARVAGLLATAWRAAVVWLKLTDSSARADTLRRCYLIGAQIGRRRGYLVNVSGQGPPRGETRARAGVCCGGSHPTSTGRARDSASE